jgi:hypothetical protein
LINRINTSVELLANGRKGLYTTGEAEVGQAWYKRGLAGATAAFTEAAASADAETLILAEHAFLTEEKRFCDASDSIARGSLTAAINSFDDALRALSAVVVPSLYAGVDLGFPRSAKYRIDALPKDAYHLACIAHKTRLKNIQTTPGLNMTEKAIYGRRAANMGVAQNVYRELQREALAP